MKKFLLFLVPFIFFACDNFSLMEIHMDFQNNTSVDQTVSFYQHVTGETFSEQIPANGKITVDLYSGFTKKIITEKNYRYKFSYNASENTWTIVDVAPVTYEILNKLNCQIELQNIVNGDTADTITLQKATEENPSVSWQIYPQEIGTLTLKDCATLNGKNYIVTGEGENQSIVFYEITRNGKEIIISQI